MPYQVPGKIEELDEQALDLWNRHLIDLFDRGARAASRAGPEDAGSWFFNPIDEPAPGAAERSIVWTAFPKAIADGAGTVDAGRRQADRDRDNQDEYCEWTVVRNGAGKMLRAVFTTETPDYYDFLAQADPALLLELYRRLISPEVQLSDLMVGGAYDPRNRWNFPGQPANDGAIVHMVQGANNLAAAVFLAAVATWPRVTDAGQPITSEQPLIDCAGFGVASRHSDPHIGAQINALVRSGHRVSFADPVGLYIDAVDLAGWDLPGGGDPAQLMGIERGVEGFALRIAFEAPADAGYVLGDIEIGGEPLRFGGQIAERMKIRLRGIAIPHVPAPAVGCIGGGAGPLPGAAELEAGTPLSRSGQPLGRI